MGQSSIVQAKERNAAFRQWQFKEAVELEHKKQEIRDERRELEVERREFEKVKQEFEMQKQLDDIRVEQEKKLFDMKWKILESELKKLAAEKEQIARQRDFYRYVSEFQSHTLEETAIVKGEMFFCGVNNEDSLKKRYKDLIKIYHPDNQNGDKCILQEINAEYEKLKSLYE